MIQEEYFKAREKLQLDLQKFRDNHISLTEILRDSQKSMYSLSRATNDTEYSIFNLLYEKKNLVFPFLHTSRTRTNAQMRDVELGSKINQMHLHRLLYDEKSSNVEKLLEEIHDNSIKTMKLVAEIENLDKEFSKALSKEEKGRPVEALLTSNNGKFKVDIIYSGGKIVTVSSDFESIESSFQWLNTNVPNIPVRKDNLIINTILLALSEEVKSISSFIEDPNNEIGNKRKVIDKEAIVAKLEKLYDMITNVLSTQT